MYIKSFRLKLNDKNFGKLYLRKKEDKDMPIIIYCHGWGSHYFSSTLLPGSERQVRNLALKAGMGFVSFDCYAYGRTGGKISNFSYGQWAENLNDIYEYILNLKITSNDKIGCFCISSGTTTAFRMEQKYQKLAFIVSVATAISNNILIDGGPKKIYDNNKEALLSGKLLSCGKKKNLSLKFYEDEVNNLCIDNMDKINCPTFFLQGSADNKNRQNDALEGFKILSERNGKKCQYFLVEGGNHGLSNKRKACAEKTIQFVQSIL